MPTVTIERGFTLVEMLVVVLLIGLLLGVGLTLELGPGPQRLRQQGEAFANHLGLAADEAVLDGRIWGIDFFAAAEARPGYRWLRLEDERWQVTTLPGLEPGDSLFAEGLAAELTLDGQPRRLEPRVDLEALTEPALFAPEVLLLPTRELGPFSLRLSVPGGESLVLTADLLGRVRIEADAPATP